MFSEGDDEHAEEGGHEEMLSDVDEGGKAESYQNAANDCEFCQIGTQHMYRICSQPVCNLFCSVQDPTSDNEIHRVHKHGDPRCLAVEEYSCSDCGNVYKSEEHLNIHNEIVHLCSKNLFSGFKDSAYTFDAKNYHHMSFI